MLRTMTSPRYRSTWFQNTSTPVCGIGKGMPSPAFTTPLPPLASSAVVAMRLVAS
jgi:hypothetical protein